MTSDVTSLDPGLTVEEAIERVAEEGHVGLPVADGERLVGFMTPKELLRQRDNPDAPLTEVMAPGTVVAHPDMSLGDAARILFRMGVKELPVVDDEGHMVGIISTTDVIRAQIERMTPSKMEKLRTTLESLYDVDIDVVEKPVEIADLLPTQKRIYGDELDGRRLELIRGLAEPILVIEKDPQPLLVDGHHRVIAARRMSEETLEAYVLQLDRDVELGLERNARSAGLESLDDVEVLEEGQHPLVEVTTRFVDEGWQKRRTASFLTEVVDEDQAPDTLPGIEDDDAASS
jgi:IMP dehydrogenase